MEQSASRRFDACQELSIKAALEQRAGGEPGEPGCGGSLSLSLSLPPKFRISALLLLLLAPSLTFLAQGQTEKRGLTNGPSGSPTSPLDLDKNKQDDDDKDKKDLSLDDYMGDEACRPCHQEIADTYRGTAHHLTSRLPSADSIAGKFTPGSNTLRTSNPYLTFTMSATKEGFFESAVEELAPSKTISHTERIDIVIGSGRKGQTYLFWKGDRLFELPVTYWTELDGWINSPGFPDGSPRFDKPIVPRCLECHGTSFRWLPPPLNRFGKTSLVLGISCEKCHGPGREHVDRYRSKSPPAPGDSKAIINPAALLRDRQLDLCTLCHAGTAEAVGSPLSFVPGNDIARYLYIPETGPNAPVDVHGNQVQLLKRSRCFQASSMTCSTCHDVHRPQRDAAGFSGHCLSCHQPRQCGRYPTLGERITHNCVDCHMPLEESETLVSDSNGREIKPRVRNHRIAVYPDSQPH